MAHNTIDTSYQPVPEPQDSAVKQAHWNTAFGLQEVDGIKPSPYFSDLAQDHIKGCRSLAETGDLIRRYYLEQEDVASTTEQEADLVSQRIVELLSSRAFLLAPAILTTIHHTLFQDLSEKIYQPGQFKETALMKQEFVLNGDSVVYTDPSLLPQSLKFLFDEERTYFYGAEFTTEDLSHFSRFIAHLWQVYPFAEGNTRTIAVFAELYLENLGFDVANEPFAKHSRYFRDALVRANYRNTKANILPNFSFLEAFFQNLLHEAHNPLQSRALVCTALYENPDLLRNASPAKAFSTQNPC